MKQAIPGVAPTDLEEVAVMTVWPSIAAYGIGRLLGRLYNIKAGVYIFTIGNLMALVTIPIALKLYFLRVLPFFGMRYTLTNRRVILQRGVKSVDESSVDLDRFNEIEINVLPGQEWFCAGDLIFKNNGMQTFHLAGVSRPEAFRASCLKSRAIYVGVKIALARQPALA